MDVGEGGNAESASRDSSYRRASSKYCGGQGFAPSRIGVSTPAKRPLTLGCGLRSLVERRDPADDRLTRGGACRPDFLVLRAGGAAFGLSGQLVSPAIRSRILTTLRK